MLHGLLWEIFPTRHFILCIQFSEAFVFNSTVRSNRLVSRLFQKVQGVVGQCVYALYLLCILVQGDFSYHVLFDDHVVHLCSRNRSVPRPVSYRKAVAPPPSSPSSPPCCECLLLVKVDCCSHFDWHPL